MGFGRCDGFEHDGPVVDPCDVRAWSNYRVGRSEGRFVVRSTLGHKCETGQSSQSSAEVMELEVTKR